MADVDLLLVRPPGGRPLSVVPPLGLLYVAAAAREAGARVAFLDALAEQLDWDETLRRCRAMSPAVIGLGGCGPLVEDVTAASRRLAPHADRLLLGGPLARTWGRQLLRDESQVSALVVGEGEATIGPALAWLARGDRGAPPRGLLVRGHPLRERERVPDLDRLPPPARDLAPGHLYHYLLATASPVTTLITSRGCPHRCVFCDQDVSGAVPRLHSAARVVAELDESIRRHGARYAILFDDHFTADRERVLAICAGIRAAGLDVAWKCETRVDAVDAELLRAMRAAGCRAVAMGVESARPRSLEWLGKGTSPQQARAAFAACRAAGIDPLAYALVGIPREDPADALATARFCREIGARWVQFSTLSPFRGTPLYDQAVQNGWLAHSAVRNPADAERLRPTLLAPPWDEATLRRTLRRCYAAFYGRPGLVAREAVASLRPGVRRTRARAALALGRWAIGWPAA